MPTLDTSGAYTYVIITEATYYVTGIGRYTYVIDNQIITFEVIIPTSEHDYGRWSVNIPPTLISTGTIIRTCKIDSSHTETLTLPMIGVDTGYVVSITKEPIKIIFHVLITRDML